MISNTIYLIPPALMASKIEHILQLYLPIQFHRKGFKK